MRSKYFFAIATLLLSFCPTFGSDGSLNLETLVSKGDICLENGKLGEAYTAYHLAAKTYPASSIPHQRLAQVLELNNELKPAQNEDERAIKLDPNSITTHYHLGKLLTLEGRQVSNPLLARSYYLQAAHEEALALQLDPKNVNAYVAFGIALVHLGKYDTAIQANIQAITLDPNNLQAYLNLAASYGRKSDYIKAIETYKKTLVLYPNSAFAHLGLGDALGKLHDLSGQIYEYRIASQLSPDNDNIHGKLGWALYQDGNLHGAVSQGVITNWLRFKRSGPAFLQSILSWWGAIFIFFGLVFAVLIWGSRFKPEEGEAVIQSFLLVLYKDKPGRLVLSNKRLVFVPEAFSRWFGAEVLSLNLADITEIEAGYIGGISLTLTNKDAASYKFLMPNLVLQPLTKALNKMDLKSS